MTIILAVIIHQKTGQITFRVQRFSGYPRDFNFVIMG